jgi:hypothetical protein
MLSPDLSLDPQTTMNTLLQLLSPRATIHKEDLESNLGPHKNNLDLPSSPHPRELKNINKHN